MRFSKIMNKKNVLISIDDIAPEHIKNIIYIVKELEEIGICKLNLAVIPNYHEESNVSEFPQIIDLIKKQQKLGSDIIMHGYSHTAHNSSGWGYKQILFGKLFGRGQAEFLNLNEEGSEFLLGKGLDIFHKIKVNPDGFLPPVWATSYAAKKVILRRFKYCIYFNNIQYHWHSVRHKIIPFQSDYPSDKLVRLWAHIFSRMPYKNLTISLHPQNVSLGTQFEFALKLIKKFAEHNITTYSKL